MTYQKSAIPALFIIVLFTISTVLFKSSTHIHEEEAIATDTILTDTSEELRTAIKYDQLIRSEIDSNPFVGLAYSIVYEDQVLLTKTYGVKKAGSTDSVDEQTVFRLASVSKGFTGVLACLLEQEGILSLNQRIKEDLPRLTLKDSASTADLTIAHTLNHTSGLVPHAYDNLAEAALSLTEIIRRLPEVDIAAKPGEVYGYQNVVFSLIDTIAYIHTYKEYCDLLYEKLFIPLDMQNASVGKGIFEHENNNTASPHVFSKGNYVTTRPNLRYYNLVPAAGVNASIRDMSQWLIALLGNCPEVLDTALLNKIATPSITTPLKKRYTYHWGHVDEKSYSLGWRIYNYKGMKIVYHGGYVRGYRSEIAYCPEERVGIAYLQNSTGSLASRSVPVFFNIWLEQKQLLAEK
ncbi:MAG: beta-lactamase family protein [Bacteroidales bacterium]|nr:beta-lactamase family protein [Bacteroidales bacterium]